MSSMPSGREIHSMKPYIPPFLEASTLENMRAPPDRADDYGDASSDEDSKKQEPIGAFPGTKDDYSSSYSYY